MTLDIYLIGLYMDFEDPLVTLKPIETPQVIFDNVSCISNHKILNVKGNDDFLMF